MSGLLGNPKNRVLQLDGYLLDGQIISIFQTQLTEAFGDTSLPVKFQRIGSRHGNDLVFLVKLLLFKLFVWDKSSSYGLILQNLKLFDNEQSGKLSRLGKLTILVHLLASYLINKLISYSYSDDASELGATNPLLSSLLQRFTNYLPIIEAGSSFLEVANRVVFFALGDYTMLYYRLFGIRHERLNTSGTSFASNPQSINYEFQDRQLIWNAFTEFITNVSDVKMPRIVQRAWRKALHRVMKKKKKNIEAVMAIDGVSVNDESSESMFRFLPERCCAICYADDTNLSKSVDEHLITNPFVTSCGHIYCYFCLMRVMEKARNSVDYDDEDDDNDQVKDDSDIEEGVKWRCLRCSQKVSWSKIYSEKMDELGAQVESYFASSVYADLSFIPNSSDDSDEAEYDAEEEGEENMSSSSESDSNSSDPESGESDESDAESAYEYDADEII
ncbi:hypothetical protein PMKS-000062 [Pichia membranifaciens]|uniref:RING-type domain-containing protein n=1 Tax=Pichia membranifaciens TaxID=4926 RepID=A0A1Q2YAW2_9ASCO|nr:hypothetical protein PMKS-000062 [Pichia membranifaciens]